MTKSVWNASGRWKANKRATASLAERATRFTGLMRVALRKFSGQLDRQRPTMVAAFWKQAGIFEECR